jgi:hypothetical protein
LPVVLVQFPPIALFVPEQELGRDVPGGLHGLAGAGRHHHLPEVEASRLREFAIKDQLAGKEHLPVVRRRFLLEPLPGELEGGQVAPVIGRASFAF